MTDTAIDNRHDQVTTSIIVPWCARPELAQSLAHNTAALSGSSAEIVVANCGGDHEWVSSLIADLDELVPVRVVSFDHRPFNKSLAINMGVSASSGSHIMVLDTDVLLDDDTLPAMLRVLDDDHYVTIECVVESVHPRLEIPPALAEFARYLEFVSTEGRTVRIETNRVRFADGSRAGPGLVLVSREAFVDAGGMNSELQGWGWEDLDLLARLEFTSGIQRRRAGTVTHLSHGDDVRIYRDDDPTSSETDNLNIAATNYQHGYYQGSYLADLAATVVGAPQNPVRR